MFWKLLSIYFVGFWILVLDIVVGWILIKWIIWKLDLCLFWRKSGPIRGALDSYMELRSVSPLSFQKKPWLPLHGAIREEMSRVWLKKKKILVLQARRVSNFSRKIGGDSETWGRKVKRKLIYFFFDPRFQKIIISIR